jgi:hypothetical protein
MRFSPVENNIKENRMNIKKYISSGVLLCTTLYAAHSYAISSAVKSNLDYTFTLETLRHIQIMVENFGDEQLKKKHADLKALFRDASEDYYSQNFTGSELKFRKVKVELIKVLEAIDDIYLKRTKAILDSTSKESFDILIQYSKESGLAVYLKKPFDPLKDIKTIDPTMYHMFHDREKITTYLREGYKKYEKALNIFNDQDINYLKKKSNLTMKGINHIISRYTELVFLCREAKQNGIEIHKLMNLKEESTSLKKYNVTHDALIPIYDDRIPEKYKVDANDNLRLIHSLEQKKLTIK